MEVFVKLTGTELYTAAVLCPLICVIILCVISKSVFTIQKMNTGSPANVHIIYNIHTIVYNMEQLFSTSEYLNLIYPDNTIWYFIQFHGFLHSNLMGRGLSTQMGLQQEENSGLNYHCVKSLHVVQKASRAVVTDIKGSFPSPYATQHSKAEISEPLEYLYCFCQTKGISL